MKEFIKKYAEATYHLFLFKTYTNMPRWMEIAYGILAWFCVGIVVCSQLSIWL